MHRFSSPLPQMSGLSDAFRHSGAATDRLTDLEDFGLNPGALRGRFYVPPGLSGAPPLVVVLHGCAQTAAGYDRGSGWSRLADIGRFALLFPEQRRENNPNLCFNWFVPDDIARGSGEAASIRGMVGTMTDRTPIDRRRIFVTGLSAGGAMAAVMLAAYPDVFAGGAIIAGLPYGCADNVPQALKRMRGEGLPVAARLADRLRQAADHRGRWPTVSLWHGSADATVAPANAEASLAQWRAVHRLAERPDEVEDARGHSWRLWRDADGRTALEAHTIAGMGHGTPLKTEGRDGCGESAPFMLDVGVSSTCIIARSWGVLDPAAVVETAARPPFGATGAFQGGAQERNRGFRLPEMPSDKSGQGIGKAIGDALRKAGLT